MSNSYFKPSVLNKTISEFELFNVPVALANSLRRCMLSEIPCIAFEDDPDKVFSFLSTINLEIPKSIKIKKNTSSLDNEYLSHRISLIPLYFNFPIIRYHFHPSFE